MSNSVVPARRRHTGALVALGGAAGVGVVTYVDWITGVELSVSIFYVIPIVLVAWFGRARIAYVLAFASGVAWLWVDVASHALSHPVFHLWNALVRLTFFLVILALVLRVRLLHRQEVESANQDALTGVANRRAFLARLSVEVPRAHRSRACLAVAYVDLDNFKLVNDRSGHEEGDRVLVEVARVLRRNVRESDLVARIGGDEFVVLMPRTEAEGAKRALGTARERLLGSMQDKGWPVTFSIGLAVFSKAPKDLRRVIMMADGLMYEVKRGGKDRLETRVFDS